MAGTGNIQVSARSRRTFQQLVTLPDNAIPLAEAALLVACEEYPQLELSPYLDQLDDIARIANRDIRPDDTPHETVAKINVVLYETFGFRGNSADFYDPRNSFLNDVLDRRVGIPITLAAVYLEVSRRLNFPIAGVGLPGHFMVKYADREQEFFLDVFNKGEILSREECQKRIEDQTGEPIELSERFLARMTNGKILLRMLNNLKQIYLKAQAFDKGLAIVDMMIMVEPEESEQYRDRGLLRLQLRQFEGAKKDFDHYLRLVPEPADKDMVQDRLKELKRIRAMMN
jgi:regulator of sirC expression with transglutaminase-like and TPR domain